MYVCDDLPTNCDCDSCIPVKDEIVSQIAASNPNVKKLFLCYPPQIDVTLGLVNSPSCQNSSVNSCDLSRPTPYKISNSAKKVFYFDDDAHDSDSMDTSNFDASKVKSISYQCRRQKWRSKNESCIATSPQSTRNCFYGMMEQICPLYFRSSILNDPTFSWATAKRQNSDCSSFPNFMDNTSVPYSNQSGSRSCYLSELSYQTNYLKYDDNLLRDRNLLNAFQCLMRKSVASVMSTGGEAPLSKIGDSLDLKELANIELSNLYQQYSGCFSSSDHNAPSISELKVTYSGDTTKNEVVDPVNGSLGEKTDVTYKKYDTAFTIALGFSGAIGSNLSPECGSLTASQCYCVACYYGNKSLSSWCKAQESAHQYSIETTCANTPTTENGNLVCKESIAEPYGASDPYPIFPYPNALVTLNLSGSTEIANEGYWTPRIHGSMAYSISDRISFDVVGTEPTDYLVMKTFADWEQIGPAKEVLISNTANYGMGRCRISTGGTGNCTFEQTQLITANYYPPCRANYCSLSGKNCMNNSAVPLTGIDSRNDAETDYAASKWIVETGKSAGTAEYARINRVFSGMGNNAQARTHTALLRRTSAEEENLPGCLMMKESFLDPSYNSLLTSRYITPRVECWDGGGDIKTGLSEYNADTKEKELVITTSSDSINDSFEKILNFLKNSIESGGGLPSGF